MEIDLTFGISLITFFASIFILAASIVMYLIKKGIIKIQQI